MDGMPYHFLQQKIQIIIDGFLTVSEYVKGICGFFDHQSANPSFYTPFKL